jgi:hypothetical protein
MKDLEKAALPFIVGLVAGLLICYFAKNLNVSSNFNMKG